MVGLVRVCVRACVRDGGVCVYGGDGVCLWPWHDTIITCKYSPCYFTWINHSVNDKDKKHWFSLFITAEAV